MRVARQLLARSSGKTVLNAFAHTGALSVAAAKVGAVTTSLDLSRRYLDWARENQTRNGLDRAFRPDPLPEEPPLQHGNIRGSGYYH